jgi:predicted outer membrane repeat protein
LGGAINVVWNSIVNLKGNSFENNNAAEGGALWLNKKSILIARDNIFQNNYADKYGGAVVVSRNSTGAVMGNFFESNSAANSGGAFYVNRNCTFILIGNIFENNYAHSNGGAIAVARNSTVTIRENSLENNSAARGGVAFISDESTFTLAENKLQNNSAEQLGGALVATQKSVVTLTENSFRFNSAIYGGAIYITDESTLFLAENILQNNSAEKHGGALGAAINSVVTSTENLFQFNLAKFGGAIFVEVNSVFDHINGTLYVEKNTALYGGGILLQRNSTLTLSESMLSENSAVYGGALYLEEKSMLILTNTTLQNNLASEQGGALLVSENSTAIINGDQFIDNNAERIGGAVLVDRNGTLIGIQNTFWNNSAIKSYGLGGALFVDGNSTLTLIKNTFWDNTAKSGGTLFIDRNCTISLANNWFENNFGSVGSGVMFARQSVLNLTSNDFTNNTGKIGGTIFCVKSNLSMYKNHSLWDNTAEYGGGIAAFECQVELNGNTIFQNNSAIYGGGLYADRVQLSGHVQFIQNTATEGGGGAYASRSTFTFEQNVTFIENSAIDGGGLLFSGDSEISFIPNASVYLIGNSAKKSGGALKIENSPLSFCANPSGETYSLSDCFFQIKTQREYLNTSASEIEELHNVMMHFHNNTAMEAGATIHGGLVDNCKLNSIQTLSSQCPWPISCPTSGQVFDIISTGSKEPLNISSDPVYICPCSGDKAACSLSSRRIPVYPGGTVEVSVIAYGQRNGTTPAIIHSDLPLSTIAVKDPETTQSIGSSCSNVTYTIQTNAVGTSQTIFLYAEGSCLPRERTHSSVPTNSFNVILDILTCPVGFQLSTSGSACICEQRLLPFTNTCRINDKSVLRPQNVVFWMGYSQDNNSEGLILHPHCPFHYCTSREMYIAVEDSNKQCSQHRSGLLCGQCDQNFSLALGSSRCLQCTNSRLVLLVAFLLAGLALVFLLLLLRLTVAAGTINSLIFYANILGVNSAVFFPPEITNNVLSVFIAWLNLDLGIETCFYDGMDAYAKTWLQFAFPFYVWVLVAMIILISHKSLKVAAVLGRNPVAVLATLFLLSYAKLLRAIIMALSFTFLDYPNGSRIAVWLYDGNISYLSGRHIPLFIMSIICLVFLFLPYTLLLFLGQWLRAKSRWKLLSWINDYRVIPFLDAYHAPYTEKHRYWTGLMLLFRCTLFLVFAFNTLGDSSVNLMAIVTASALKLVVIACSALFGTGIHKTHYLSILEILSNLNLLFLSATTLYIQLTGNNQTTATFVSVGLAFALFIIIIIGHTVQQIKSAPYFWKKICSHNHDYDPIPQTDDESHSSRSTRPSSPLSASAGPNIIEIDLRDILANAKGLREPCMGTDY